MTRSENLFSLIFVELKQQTTSWNANQSRIKKINFQIVFRRVRKIRKRSHLLNVALQRDHLRKAKKIINCWDFIDVTSNHRINYILDEKTNFKIEFYNHFHFFVLIQLINCRRSFFLNFSTAKINTFNIELISSIFSIFNVLKRQHYRLFEFIKFVDYEIHEKRY